jgi:hypothetical protein
VIHNWRALQDVYGRTPLHVAASCGAVRTCDGIVSASTSGINMVDMFGQTALDAANNNKKQPAVKSLILTNGGLPGNDPSIRKEHEDVRVFAERQHHALKQGRTLKVLEELPEFKLRLEIACVEGAFQKFMEVCSESCIHQFQTVRKEGRTECHAMLCGTLNLLPDFWAAPL